MDLLSLAHSVCFCFCFQLGNTSTETLSWNTRIKIAIGAARGLAFLHTSEKQIIYRDFKASNILLDEVSYFYLLPLSHFSYIFYLFSLP